MSYKLTCPSCDCPACGYTDKPVNTLESRRTGVPYVGPSEFYRRFMAGFNVTQLEYLTDHSDWIAVRVSPYHARRMHELAGVVQP